MPQLRNGPYSNDKVGYSDFVTNAFRKLIECVCFSGHIQLIYETHTF